MTRLQAIARITQEGSLYVLLFLLPFSKAAVELLFGMLLAGWLLARLHPATRRHSLWFKPPWRPLAIAGFAYLFVGALSITVSEYPWKSFHGLIAKWAEYLLFFVIAADLGAQPRVLQRAVIVLACSSLFVVVEALSQELMGAGLFRGYSLKTFERMTGPYENPIDLATYLMMVIPILLMAALASRRWIPRVFLGGVCLTLLACFIRTEALGAWIGLAVAVFTMAAVSPATYRFGLALIVVFLLTGLGWLQHEGRLHSTLSLADVGLRDRWVMWQAGAAMVRDRPLLGHGLNTFMAKYLDYRVGGEPLPRYAHNCYLQVAAETGLIGLTCFLALLGIFFSRLWGRLRRLTVSDHGQLLGFATALTAFAVQAALDTNFYALRQAALFWTLAGTALGFSESMSWAAQRPDAAREHPHPVL